jgi:hypothetical protein
MLYLCMFCCNMLAAGDFTVRSIFQIIFDSAQSANV